MARRLKRARKEAGLSRNGLEKMACISNGVVHGIEEVGRLPGIDIAEALALVLGMSPCALAYGVELALTAEELRSAGIGGRLHAARERMGLSRNALGKLAGLSHTAIGNVESGDAVPGIDVAEQLAGALGVAVCWLAYGEGDIEPPPRRRRVTVRHPEDEGEPS